ncbi:hypothetical protein NY08_229 [Rhodococcus sp. B7740]|nr:hypothetical protein NY08_229 [Rhodococcus sp. B7740]
MLAADEVREFASHGICPSSSVEVKYAHPIVGCPRKSRSGHIRS